MRKKGKTLTVFNTSGFSADPTSKVGSASVGASGGSGGSGGGSQDLDKILEDFQEEINKELNKYLRKDKDDRSTGIISTDKGFETGEFVTGMIGGAGAMLDLDENGKSVLEIDKIHAREELVVPTITFNNVEVISGDKANTFAYGTIKSVDTTRRIAELELLEDEYGTLKINDILRGIFHNIEGGNSTETKEDGNGFFQYSGFFTSYFTPISIIINEPGRMQFSYSIQSGTTAHPCAGMRFFAYGNFLDPDRQSITYENREYKRRLTGMNRWNIIPTKHIAMQDGNLEGLNIGGMEMHGYGTYQSNSYFTGTQIQFTPDQLESLRGEDAYSVTLSDYEGIVVVDDEGRIIGGSEELMNVVTEGQNVITEGQNVVTKGYRLQTSVQARRGSTPLFYSTIVEDGAYIIGLDTTGCTAAIFNGVIIVTSITDVNNSRVQITVNCEGRDVFILDYKVTAVKDGRNPITMDIDNEMDSVACDSSGKYLFGLPTSFQVNMWAGTEKLMIEHLDIDVPQTDGVDSVGYTAEVADYTDEETGETTSYYTGKVTVNSVLDNADRVIPVNVTAYATYGDIQYYKSKVFTLNKVIAGENALLYKLRPSSSVLQVDEAGQMTEGSVSCVVVASDGNTISELGSLPENIYIKYYIDDDSTNKKEYGYGSSISVTKDNRQVTFVLYVNDVLYDIEQIPVIKDGMTTKIDTVFSTLESPSAPSGHPNTNTQWEAYVEGKNYIWQAISTYSNGAWSEWVVTKVKVEDVVTYVIDPPVLNLRYTLTGTITPQETTFTCYRCQGETRTPAVVTWQIKGKQISDEGWTVLGSTTVASSIPFKPNQLNTYDEYLVTALPDGYENPIQTQVMMSKDRKGPMPRYCGFFDEDEKYYYNDEYRDIVVEDGNVYQVWAYNPSGYISGVRPSSDMAEEANDGVWEKANKFSFVAMDTALIDGAHIAGFTFKDNTMIGGSADSPTLKLDGINGKIEASWGKIGGFDLIGSELMGENTVVYPDNPEISGKQTVLLAPDGLNMYSSSVSSSVQYYEVSIGEREDYGIHLDSLNRGGIYVSTTNTSAFSKYALYVNGFSKITGSLIIDGNLTVSGTINGESGGGGNGNVVFVNSVSEIPPDSDENILYVVG